MASWSAVGTQLRDPSNFRAYLTENLRRNLRVFPIWFVVTSIYHTYLLAYKYDGFHVSPGAHVIGRGNYFWGTVEWFVVPALLFCGVGFARAAGTAFVSGQLQRIPGGLQRALQEVQRRLKERPFQEGLLIYVGVIAAIAHQFRPSYGTPTLLWALALAALAVAGLSAPKDAAAESAPPRKQLWFIALCLAIGLAIGATQYGGLGLIAAGVGVFLWWRRTSGKPPHPGERAAMWLLLVSAGWLLSQEWLAADDGGWSEFKSANPDKGLWDWAIDPEGQRVIAHGVGGGAVATAGGIAGDYAGRTAGRIAGGGGGSVASVQSR